MQFTILNREDAKKLLKPPDIYVRGLEIKIPKTLLQSIRDIGIISPIIVDKNYIIIDGVRRYIALELVDGVSEVPVIVLDDVDYNNDKYRFYLYSAKLNNIPLNELPDDVVVLMLRDFIVSKLLKFDLKKRNYMLELIKQGKIPFELLEDLPNELRAKIDLLNDEFSVKYILSKFGLNVESQ